MLKRKSQLTDFEKVLLSLPPYEFHQLSQLSQKYPDLLTVMEENFKEKQKIFQSGSSDAITKLISTEQALIEKVFNE